MLRQARESKKPVLEKMQSEKIAGKIAQDGSPGMAAEPNRRKGGAGAALPQHLSEHHAYDKRVDSVVFVRLCKLPKQARR